MGAARYSFKPSPDELRRQYLSLRLGAPEIAFFCGCDPTTAHNWLAEAGVPMRRRGNNTLVHFKRGHTASRGRKASAETKAKIGAATRARPNKGFMRNGVHFLKGVSGLPFAKKTGFAVHHALTFQVKETRAEPDNLILLCRHCHFWVHGKENKAGYFLAVSIPTLFDLLAESEAA